MSSISLLLASNSPRRRQMLAWLGCPYRVQTVDIDETKNKMEGASDYVMRIARAKAQAALTYIEPGETLVCADTIVADGDQLLGKPANATKARQMLLGLKNKTHQVYSAIVVYHAVSEHLLSDLCCSQVTMRDYTDGEIDAYIAGGDPMDKAGSYAIQHTGFHPVTNFHDCYASVMGLPLCHLLRTLHKLDIDLTIDMPDACYQNLAYHCEISRDILTG